MQLGKLSRTDSQVAVAAVVLLISMLFFPWVSISLGVLTATSSATGSPDAAVGILALLAVILILADLLVERYSPQTTVPSLGGSREMTRFFLACAVGVLVALKFLLWLHFKYLGWGFFVDIIATAGLIYASLLARRGSLT